MTEEVCIHQAYQQLQEANERLIETLNLAIDERAQAIECMEQFRELAVTFSERTKYMHQVVREKEATIELREERIQQLEHGLAVAADLIRSKAPELTRSPLFFQIVGCIEAMPKRKVC